MDGAFALQFSPDHPRADQLNGLFGAGYDSKRDALTIGPTATVR
jgi:hypothetical protein